MKDFAIIGSEARSTTEAFGKALLELADQHSEVCALSADLAGSVKVTIMQKKYPERVFDVGIAEQNMISMAAGLALGGLVPFAATFSVFASLRDLDQIHTDICYQNANVKMLGSHGGTSFSQAGSTHHALEDIAALRGMANLTIICPADYIETQLATKAVYEKFGPMYIRINRGTDYDVYNTYDYGFEIGKAVRMTEGKDFTVIACGSMVYQALIAADSLKKKGIDLRVVNMHTIKPIDKEEILKAMKETGGIITAEDHNVIGALGSAVAEVIAENGGVKHFKRLGIPDEFSIIGARKDILAHYEIDAAGIEKNVLALLGK